MATDDEIVAHPGDVAQDSTGHLYLISETHRTHVGAVQRWRDGESEREAYFRLRHGEFAVVGSARLLPDEVAQRRRDSLATARAVATEAGVACPPRDAVDVVYDLLDGYDGDADQMESAVESARAWLREPGR